MRYTERIGLVALAAMVLVTIAAVDVSAGPRDHNNGFFMRLSAGAGAAATEITALGTKEKFSGGAGEINLAIGGIVSPNLALHATIFGWALSDPDLSIGSITQQVNADVTMAALGGGLTYYFMPSNFYLSGSVGVGSLSLDAGGLTFSTDAGLALDLTLGKEWWVGNRWGLGAAAGVGFHAIPDGGVDENWSGASFAIRFSATYN